MRVNLHPITSRWLLVSALLCGAGSYGNIYANETPVAVQSPQTANTVSGTVTDTQGEPVIGARVNVKGESTGVSTDLNGRFTIKARPGQVLEISSVGMTKKEVTVGADGKVNVTLAEDANVLDEVVAIGYGTQKKGDITSAVASVKSEDFNPGKIGDAAELVKGKIAGLSVVNSSGDPNATSSIMLRGATTLVGSVTPLVLIDGIEGSLTTVAPENIAEINVLKDASAAAIYGTRGANGVILITTKSGTRDSRATATYSNYFSWTSWSKKAKFMDTHDVIMGLTSQTYEGYDTDWLKAVTRKNGFKHNHNFSVSGGGSSNTYSGNFSYSKEDGIMRHTGNEKMKLQLDYTQYLWNDILKINFNALISRSTYQLNDPAYAYRQALIRNPSEPVYNEDGSYYENFNKFQYYNPVEIQNEYEGNTRTRFAQMVGNVTVEPIKGWQTNVMLSWGESASTTESFTSPTHYSLALQKDYNGSASKSEGNATSKSLEVTSKYFKNFNNIHRFEALVGYSYLYNSYDGFNAGNGNFPTLAYKYNNLGIGTLIKEEDRHAWMGSYRNDDTLVGFFGRISYGFDNRYNVLVSLRHEGSSKFGKNHKWATFPSVSLGWNIHNESFLKGHNDIVNNLRLRVGFGITGVIPNDPYLSLYKFEYDAYGDVVDYNGNWIQTLKVSQNANPNLKWETTREWNFGVDYGFFNNRLSGTIDFYIKDTHDLLYNYAVPSPPNLYGSTLANVGKMRNMGVEVMITGIPVQTREFQWTTTLTLSHNKNTLLSLNNDLYETDNFQELWGGLSDPISVATHCMEVGKGLGDYWGLKFAGYDKDGFALVEVRDQATGEWVLKPFNTNLNILENRQRLGNGMPSVYLGWNNTFTYKNIDLTMQFTGQFGYKILNTQRCFYENNSIAYNRLKTAADLHPAINTDRTPVLDENGNQKMVRLSSSMDQGFWSDHLENGDFLKLTNLTLGYTLPLKGSITKYLRNVRIYGSATNLFCITKYSGIDPEVSNYFMTPGVDNRDKYPTTRSFSVGMSFNF